MLAKNEPQLCTSLVALAANTLLQRSPRDSAHLLLVLQVMREQETGGKIFFIDGTGAWGNPTPQNVAYGAAKRAITQVKVGSSPHPKAIDRGQWSRLRC